MAQLQFIVRHQMIRRSDCFQVVSDSQNFLTAQFKFGTEEWEGVNKTAIFRKVGSTTAYSMVLDVDGVCQVPNEVLVGNTPFEVSVYAGKLITVNTANINTIVSGYTGDAEESEDIHLLITANSAFVNMDLSGYSDDIEEPTQDVYFQILRRLYGIEHLEVSAVSLSDTSDATVSKSLNQETGGYEFEFGIPRGVSAYTYAVEQGYSGTEEEFATLMASYATVAEQAAESANRAEQAARNAGYMWLYIDDSGNLVYERTENVSVTDFYLEDGNLVMEVN